MAFAPFELLKPFDPILYQRELRPSEPASALPQQYRFRVNSVPLPSQTSAAL